MAMLVILDRKHFRLWHIVEAWSWRCVIIAIAGATSFSGRADAFKEPTDSFRLPTQSRTDTDRFVCGPNSLFLFLELCGCKNVSLKELQGIPVLPKGASLLDLHKAADRFGVSTIIRRFPGKDVERLELPAIIQLRTGDGPGDFHFCVLYETHRLMCYVLDGTTGERRTMDRNTLSNLWTGFALTKTGGFLFGLARILGSVPAMLCLLALTAVALCSKTRRWYRSKQVSAASRHYSVLKSVAALLVAWMPLYAYQGKSAPADQEIWRSPANDGINAMYCYLRINGIQCDYSALAAQGFQSNRQATLLSLSRLGERNGRPLQAALLTIEQLKTCEMPVLIQLSDRTPEAGKFVLLFRINDEKVDWLCGNSATIASVDMSTFRRQWEGAALIPKAQSLRDSCTGFACLLLGFLVPLCIPKRKRHS